MGSPGNQTSVARWLGVGLALASVWPMSAALDAVGGRDYLGGGLLLAVTYVLARTGVELAALGGRVRDPGEPS